MWNEVKLGSCAISVLPHNFTFKAPLCYATNASGSIYPITSISNLEIFLIVIFQIHARNFK